MASSTRLPDQASQARHAKRPGCHHHEDGGGHHHSHGRRTRSKKTGILLAAFGAALPGARDGYEMMDREVREAFPSVLARWAFTSNKIRRKLAERGLEHDSVAVALSRLYDDGVTHLAVQSLHTVPGVEFHWTRDQAMVHRHPRKGFLEVAVGGPLLHGETDLEAARQGLAGYIPDIQAADEAVVLVGHGTYHEGHKRYGDFEQCAADLSPRIFVGALMGRPHCDDTLQRLKQAGAKRLHLVPFMCAPGHHVRVDVCGDSPRSWKNRLTQAGFQVTPHLKGTMEHAPYRALWLQHLSQAIAELAPGE